MLREPVRDPGGLVHCPMMGYVRDMANAAAREFGPPSASHGLVAAGDGRQQAESIGVIVRAGLATKAGLDRFDARLDAKISGLETPMLRVAIAIVLAQTVLTAALTAGLTLGLLEMFGGAP